MLALITPYIEVVNFDRFGKVVGHIPRRVCQSWVKNYYNFCFSMFTSASNTTANDLDIRNTGGSAIENDNSISMTPSQMKADAGEALGILVGTGDTAEDFGMGASPAAQSYVLDAVVAHGTGAGQLVHQEMEYPDYTRTGVGAKTHTFDWKRYFNNSSGSTITIKETGIYKGTTYMLARDVLSPTQDVGDSGQLLVTYSLVIGTPA